ncbi:MAG: TetR/AcrR family transcriptional regulator [Myxococcales bacterium]|nr:TetR/AcrR family transcriptional regulator [Myxococcales bacterium]
MARAEGRGDAKHEERRASIVRAATELFSRYGYKRTSMDLLAGQAGVAKPTLYAYFADKDALFRAVVASFCDDLLLRAREASEGDGPIEARIAGMLTAKFTRYWELVQASPHAGELVDSHGTLASDVVQAADAAFVALLVRTLAASDLDVARAGLSHKGAAALLVRAASGAAYDATDARSHARHVTELVRVIVRGMQ